MNKWCWNKFHWSLRYCWILLHFGTANWHGHRPWIYLQVTWPSPHLSTICIDQQWGSQAEKNLHPTDYHLARSWMWELLHPKYLLSHRIAAPPRAKLCTTWAATEGSAILEKNESQNAGDLFSLASGIELNILFLLLGLKCRGDASKCLYLVVQKRSIF